MQNKEQIIALLESKKKQAIAHMDMLQCLNRNEAQILYADNAAILLWHVHAKVFLMTIFDRSAEDEVFERLNEFAQSNLKIAMACVIHQAFCFEQLKKTFGLEQKKEYYQLAYLKKEKVVFEQQNVKIKQLTIAHLQEMDHEMGKAYLKDRIESGQMVGAFIEGVFAGYIGIHDEGSVGLLKVFEPFRRRGIAKILESYMTNRELEKGHTPFVQVDTKNNASLALQKKMGYQGDGKPIYWVY